MKNYSLLCLTYLLLITPLFAQDSITAAPAENYVRIDYQNDFFNATDRYFTQGINLSITHSGIERSPVTLALIKLNKQVTNYYTLAIEQDGFTPRSITYTTIRYDERPYCGLLFLSHGLTSINAKKKLLLYTQLDLGVMGYITGGEAEQKAIHKAINGDQPLGWENQIKTDAVINYRAKLEKGILVTKHLEFMLNSTARVGSLYTDIGVGAHARVGLFNSYFANLGLQKHTVKNKFKIYLTTKLNTTLVGYNATMQGGLFNSKSILEVPTTNINRNVHAAYLGITVGYKRFSLEYNRTFITPEFKGGLYHGWGGLTINVCF